jgi:hypothetical protein
MPKDEPLAANPPDGAAIDYILPAGSGGPVSLTIYDAKSEKFESFTSDEKPQAAPDPRILEFAPEWVPPKSTLSAAPGMHRFVWDLHHGGPATSDDPSTPNGVWAPPGSYTIELNAGGRLLRQPLTVKPDPRVKVGRSALMDEFVLAVKVQGAARQAAGALKDATALLKELGTRESHDAKLQPQIRDLMTRISAISGIPVPWERRAERSNAPPPPGSLADLSAEFANLQQVVDGADAEPSPDARGAYLVLSRSLDSKLQQWQQLKTSDIAQVDTGAKGK